MALVRWQPKNLERRSMNLLENSDLDNLLSWAWGDGPFMARSRNMVPAMDVREEEGRYVVSLDLPGMTRDDIEITFQDGVLSIMGTKKEEKETKEGTRYFCRERFQGEFSRTLQIPDKVDLDKVDAKFSDGVLELSLPFKPEASPRKIQINK